MEHAGKRESFLSKASSRISTSFDRATGCQELSKGLEAVRGEMRVMEGTLPFGRPRLGASAKRDRSRGRSSGSWRGEGGEHRQPRHGSGGSVKVYREGTDDKTLTRMTRTAGAKRAASVTKHTQLATVDEASEGDADGGAGDGGG